MEVHQKLQRGYGEHQPKKTVPSESWSHQSVLYAERVDNEFIDECDTAIVTFIDKEYQADSYFPNLDEDPAWELAEESEEQVYFDITYTYRTYKKK